MTGLGAPTPDALARACPEAAPWLRVLGRAREAARRGTSRAQATLDEARAPDAPVLAGAVIEVDGSALARLAAALGAAAGRGVAAAGATWRRLDAVALLEAALTADGDRVTALAAGVGVEAGALGAIGQALAMSVLWPVAASLEDRIPPGWTRGSCPFCGAWPTLAEERGLERTRRLRCARCGAAWPGLPLQCPYCGTTDHTRLGSLRLEAALETRRVDLCDACRGYLKTVVTLGALDRALVPLADLATVELDLAALARGYARPPEPDRPLAVRVRPRPPRGARRWWSLTADGWRGGGP